MVTNIIPKQNQFNILNFTETKIVPFLYYAYIIAIFSSIALTNILGLLSFILILTLRTYRYFKFKEEFFPNTPLNKIIGLMFLVNVLAIITSPFLSKVSHSWFWYVVKNRQILFFFFHIAVITYYIDYKKILKFILYISPIFAIFAFYDSLSNSRILRLSFNTLYHWPPSIIKGELGNYINYAFIHNLVILTLMPFIFLLKKTSHKILISNILVFEFFCIYFSGSRTAFLSSFLGFFIEAFVLWAFKQKYWKHYLGSLLALITLVSLSLFTVTAFKNRARLNYTVSNISKFGDIYRFNLWKINLKMFQDYPVLGVGNIINAEKVLQKKYYKKANVPQNLIHKLYGFHAHNTYIQFLAGSGMVGFILLLFLLYSIIRLLILTIKQKIKDKFDIYLIVGLSGAIGVMFGISFTDLLFLKQVYNNLLMLVFALIVYIYLKHAPHKKD